LWNRNGGVHELANFIPLRRPSDDTDDAALARQLLGEPLGFFETFPFHITARRFVMNADQIKGNWKQLKGKVKEQWGKLTDDDITVIDGEREQLLGKLQERYGYSKEQAERELERQQTSW
jgi:uncharacterized protein YjbJ (UPF0337 family)